jgi:hypothetical protein
MNSLPPYQLIKTLEEALRAVRGIGSVRNKDYKTPEDYRLAIRKALSHLKDTSIAIMQSGHSEAMEAVAKIGKEVTRQCSEPREPMYNEIFWDELTNFYPQTSTYLWQSKGLSHDTELKAYTRALEYSTSPDTFIRNTLSYMPDEMFIDVLTMAVERLSMPYRKIDMILDHAFDALRRRLNTSEFQEMAAEHILAHQNIYFPVLGQLVGLCNREKAYDRQSRDRAHHHEMREAMYTLLDYKPEEMTSAIDLPSSEEIRSLGKSLSWPAEFLARLYEGAQHPAIKAQAELTFDNPDGPIPYWHFEKMGIVRSPEWFQEAQCNVNCRNDIKLYEHVIHTAGIEIMPKWILNTNTGFSSQALDECIAVLTRVKSTDLEVRRKSQVLFDALVERGTGPSNQWIINRLKDSSINPRFYAGHAKLRGDLLESKLGL